MILSGVTGPICSWASLCGVVSLMAATAFASDVSIKLDGPGRHISPDLFGIFFEDLNYAADGGLYAELVQNRSFEYDATEQPTWGPLTGWDFIKRGNGAGELWVDSSCPLHPNNRHSVLIEIRSVGDGVGLSNAGFDGIAVKAGEKYDFSVFARMIYAGTRRENKTNGQLPLNVRLETKDGTVLGEADIAASGPMVWKQLTATITASQTVTDARLVVLARSPGLVALDEVSLFPQNTFKGRKNGLRADLAQTVADLHPKFMRFPGGCLTHGDGVDNIYRWKNTIGPVEQRKGQVNIWRYHQSVGLGYFEYFQFCEDIGAKPLPVIAAGVSCQNSTRAHGTGQQCIPLADMPTYIQDTLDLIEWANGPTNSTWGAKRAAAGHPAPFGLEYLGVGNEDKITPEFKERFQMIYDAVKQAHPEITVVGTVGPDARGDDYDKGWQIANELSVPVVDEHYYKSPQWFWDNQQRYDHYDRTRSHVYLGEYASGGNTLFNALAEAAYMTSLERNGDVVQMASYAPLLCKQGHIQWKPDMIYFDNTNILRSVNYYVQQLFAQNSGDTWLPANVTSSVTNFALSCVKDSRSGDLILKLVNVSSNSISVQVDLGTAAKVKSEATRTVLTGVSGAINTFADPHVLEPQTTPFAAAGSFTCDLPPYSFSLIRMKTK